MEKSTGWQFWHHRRRQHLQPGNDYLLLVKAELTTDEVLPALAQAPAMFSQVGQTGVRTYRFQSHYLRTELQSALSQRLHLAPADFLVYDIVSFNSDACRY